jgi:hypothetical protein
VRADSERHDSATGGATDPAAEVARYEQLRDRALSGDADGWRAGLAVLQTRGVAAWLRAWRGVSTPPQPASARTGIGAGAPAQAADRLVAALASMALGALARA